MSVVVSSTNGTLTRFDTVNDLQHVCIRQQLPISLAAREVWLSEIPVLNKGKGGGTLSASFGHNDLLQQLEYELLLLVGLSQG